MLMMLRGGGVSCAIISFVILISIFPPSVLVAGQNCSKFFWREVPIFPIFEAARHCYYISTDSDDKTRRSFIFLRAHNLPAGATPLFDHHLHHRAFCVCGPSVSSTTLQLYSVDSSARSRALCALPFSVIFQRRFYIVISVPLSACSCMYPRTIGLLLQLHSFSANSCARDRGFLVTGPFKGK